MRGAVCHEASWQFGFTFVGLLTVVAGIAVSAESPAEQADTLGDDAERLSESLALSRKSESAKGLASMEGVDEEEV